MKRSRSALMGVFSVVFASYLLSVGGSTLAAGNRLTLSVSYQVYAKQNAGVKPAVAPYKVQTGLANVTNLKLFKKDLEPNQIQKIAKNGFVVSPTEYNQMFHVYENNGYQRPQMYPSFITADSMLHTYHVFYDYSLRVVESTKLYDTAINLTDAMLSASQRDLIAATSPQMKDAALRNVAYFALARRLLQGTPPPANVSNMVEADLVRIQTHAKKDQSSIVQFTIDFSQFVPRGHYTRTEKLKKYFRAMMFYGLAPLPVPDPKAYDPALQSNLARTSTRQALLITRNLRLVRYKGQSALKLWDMIYEPTAFYVGTADDLTVYDYSALSDKVYGVEPAVEVFADDAKLDSFFNEVKKLKGPGIEIFGGEDAFAATGPQLRFMGQRFIADSRILQEMCYPKVVRRMCPSGLDVLAALGSERAHTQLASFYGIKEYPNFETQLTKMRKEIDNAPDETWQSNIYYGWLWGLQSLIKPAPHGYPSFMRNEAWQDKSLLTALGSWTELRHDTILYAKQSATAECGGDGEEIKTPKGYVEPNLEFWAKLKWLNEYTRKGLASRGLLNEELKDKFATLGDWIEFCRSMSAKELTNKRLTDEEYQQISMYGPALEQMTLSFAGEGDVAEVTSDTDKDMAIIADVHTFNGKALEEGTGRAAAIYVVVPIEGKLYLTRGAVYLHYEFVQPADNRLTDEDWQTMLKKKNQPLLAPWLKNILAPTKKMPPMDFWDGTDAC